MKNYNGSECHRQNARAAREKGRKKLEHLFELRKNEYNLNPNYCAYCNCVLDYSIRKNKFCSHSCSAKFSNSHRKYKVSDSHKKHLSMLLSEKYKSGELKSKKYWGQNISKTGNTSCAIKSSTCTICGKLFITRSYISRKTCSKRCKTIASTQLRTYQNGSRKPVWYFNKWQNKKVLLESSWEVKVAEKLDTLNIKWIRPETIGWVDNKQKSHLYYPDFYLTEHNIYLDPKNKYCMTKDKEKMEKISEKVNIIYGDLNLILEFINNKICPGGEIGKHA